MNLRYSKELWKEYFNWLEKALPKFENQHDYEIIKAIGLGIAEAAKKALEQDCINWLIRLPFLLELYMTGGEFYRCLLMNETECYKKLFDNTCVSPFLEALNEDIKEKERNEETKGAMS